MQSKDVSAALSPTPSGAIPFTSSCIHGTLQVLLLMRQFGQAFAELEKVMQSEGISTDAEQS